MCNKLMRVHVGSLWAGTFLLRAARLHAGAWREHGHLRLPRWLIVPGDRVLQRRLRARGAVRKSVTILRCAKKGRQEMKSKLSILGLVLILSALILSGCRPSEAQGPTGGSPTRFGPPAIRPWPTSANITGNRPLRRI